jgi:hypothetical protein|tara:strand:- start:2059 stop:2916 length:858 start_codon:yes stop_codon:yes gene_type:complete
MSFFKNFPLIRYDINKDGNRKLAVDIMKRIVFRSNLQTQASIWSEYVVTDGETPEIVSYKFLGSSKLHWIILLMNEITDPYFQWPMSEASLNDYIEKKYEGKAYYIGNESGAYFKPNEEVYKSGSPTVRGLVKSYDPTYRRLTLYNTQGRFSVSDGIVGKDSAQIGTITRIVDINGESVHHFENADTNYLYEDLDPLASPPSSGKQVMLGATGAGFGNGTTDGVTFGSTILYSYVNSLDGSTTTHSVLTNRAYETALNESRRSVKILRPEYVNGVVDDLNRVVSR